MPFSVGQLAKENIRTCNLLFYFDECYEENYNSPDAVNVDEVDYPTYLFSDNCPIAKLVNGERHPSNICIYLMFMIFNPLSYVTPTRILRRVCS